MGAGWAQPKGTPCSIGLKREDAGAGDAPPSKNRGCCARTAWGAKVRSRLAIQQDSVRLSKDPIGESIGKAFSSLGLHLSSSLNLALMGESDNCADPSKGLAQP